MKIVALTGAGISQPSGVATFRDAGGLWEGHRIEEVASPEGWRHNPQLVLDFYNLRRAHLGTVVPNAAHLALAEWESTHDVVIVTQNVDDLHERAGSKRILHLHGQLTKARSSVNPAWVQDIGYAPIQLGDRCPQGGQLRPHIVWFGEQVDYMKQAQAAVAEAEVVLVIGTSLQVYPAAGLVDFANDKALRILVDPRPGRLPEGFKTVTASAEIGVPALGEFLLKTAKGIMPTITQTHQTQSFQISLELQAKIARILGITLTGPNLPKGSQIEVSLNGGAPIHCIANGYGSILSPNNPTFKQWFRNRPLGTPITVRVSQRGTLLIDDNVRLAHPAPTLATKPKQAIDSAPQPAPFHPQPLLSSGPCTLPPKREITPVNPGVIDECLSLLNLSPLPHYLNDNCDRIKSLGGQILAPWRSDIHEISGSVMDQLRAAFPAKTLTRVDVVALFEDWLNKLRTDPVLCLVAAMVWGGITAQHLLSLLAVGEAVLREKMNRLVPLVRSGALEQAFSACSNGGKLKFDGVGASYFTKIFYFIGQVPPSLNPAPLIFDKWTANAFCVLGKQVCDSPRWTELFDADPLCNGEPVAQRLTRIDASVYRIYVAWFNHWAILLGVTPSTLEQFVFGYSRKTIQGRGPDNPRNQIIALGKTLFCLQKTAS